MSERYDINLRHHANESDYSNNNHAWANTVWRSDGHRLFCYDDINVFNGMNKYLNWSKLKIEVYFTNNG